VATDRGQVGVEWRAGDAAFIAETYQRIRACLDSRHIEAMIKTMFPGRAYWIEEGTDSHWMQTVEYGTFVHKPDKQLKARSSRAERPNARNRRQLVSKRTNGRGGA
jgi:hypothetical protein